MKLSKKWIFINVIILIVVVLWGVGRFLDRQAEFAVQNLYVRNSDGVIKGLESRAIVHHATKALLLLHGFARSPEVFDDFISAAKANDQFDIYAPLLPYHGRNLQVLAQLDNEKVIQFASVFLKKLSQQYKQVTVLGFSYSGTILVELMRRAAVPANVHVILYAPAVYIKSNHFSNDELLYGYSLWRKYCNYKLLGCSEVNYDSGDSDARSFLEHEKTFRYVVAPAIKQLYALDRDNRNYIWQIKRPYDLIVALDDNRMPYTLLAQICRDNKKCNLHAFSSGRHYLLLGKYKNEFNALVVRLVQQASKT